VVEGKGLVELKGLVGLEAVLVARARRCLAGYKLPVGLLINFGAARLEFRRHYRKEHPVHP